MRRHQEGFSAPIILSAIIIVIIIGIIGWQVHDNQKKHTTTPVSAPTSLQSTSANTNGIHITSPKNGEIVGRTFTISGTAPKPTSQYSETVQIIFDHDAAWSLTSPSTTQMKVQANGDFSIPLNLNGTKALQQMTATTAGETISYRAITNGLHTFTINIVRAGTVSNFISNTPGPTISLTVQ